MPGQASGRMRRINEAIREVLSGLVRPAIVADPVHFKYLGGTRLASARRRPLA